MLPHPLAPSTHLSAAYFVAAHVALGLALAAVAAEPTLPWAVDARPRLTGLLHLVTLGWISGSILGALYLVMPLAFAKPLRATRADRAAFAAFWSGTAGIVGAFWTHRFSDVALASVPVLAAVAFIGARTIRALMRAPLPRAIRVHVGLAFGNVLVAGVGGLLMALSLARGGLPWSSLPLAEAHAHLAVLGWAVMMIFGVGYRLLPMVLPAAMPRTWTLGLSAALLEAGTLGLCVSFVLGADPRVWGIIVLLAFAAFFAHVNRMLARRRPSPFGLPRPDWSTLHTALALTYALGTAVVGVYLLGGPPSPTARWIYGAAGLLGFASQIVVGIQGRLVPLQEWFRAMEAGGGVPPAISVHRLIAPRLAATVFLLWLGGLPLLIGGLARQQGRLVAAGAVLLLLATLANMWHGLVLFARTAKARSISTPWIQVT
jgi:hypothetical protein